MNYLCCPKCRKRYTVLQVNIAGQKPFVNACTDCGWLSAEIDDHTAVYFTDEYLDYTLPDLTGALITTGWMEKIDPILIKEAFNNRLTYSHGSLVLRAYKGYNVPFGGVRLRIRAYEGRHSISREIDPLLKQRVGIGLLTDTFNVPVLWITDTFSTAIRLRYASAPIGNGLTNVLYVPYFISNNLMHLANLFNLVCPERIVLIDNNVIPKTVFQQIWNVPVLMCQQNALQEPLAFTIRAIEDKAVTLPPHEYERNKVIARIDEEALTDSLATLDLPEENETLAIPDFFIS